MPKVLRGIMLKGIALSTRTIDRSTPRNSVVRNKAVFRLGKYGGKSALVKVIQVPTIKRYRQCQFMDNGSAFNVMPRRTFDALGYTPNDLTPGNAEMERFERAVTMTSCGAVQAHLKLGNLDSEEVVTTVLFHVLDTQSDYDLLLGRPCMVDYCAIPSTAYWKVKP